MTDAQPGYTGTAISVRYRQQRMLKELEAPVVSTKRRLSPIFGASMDYAPPPSRPIDSGCPITIRCELKRASMTCSLRSLVRRAASEELFRPIPSANPEGRLSLPRVSRRAMGAIPGGGQSRHQRVFGMPDRRLPDAAPHQHSEQSATGGQGRTPRPAVSGGTRRSCCRVAPRKGSFEISRMPSRSAQSTRGDR